MTSISTEIYAWSLQLNLARCFFSVYLLMFVYTAAHALGSRSDGTAARALPAVASGYQEAHRRAHWAGVPRPHAGRPQGLHLRRIGL